MEKITANRNTPHTADIETPIILLETPLTRRVFKPYLNDTKISTGETVSGWLVHQKRKSKNDEWEDVCEDSLKSLRSGEGMKIKIDSSQLKILYDELTVLYEYSRKGIPRHQETITILKNTSNLINVPQSRKHIILELLKQNFGDEIWEELLSKEPDLCTKLSYAKIQSDRKKILDEFEINLTKDFPEKFWQKFFEDNTWIFGYGLDYRFLKILQREAYVSTNDLDGKNNSIVDFLLGCSNFTVLVEIKKPNTSLFNQSTSGKNRSDSWKLSNTFVDSISQILAQKSNWIIKSQQNNYNDENELITQETINPKAILIIGNASEFSGSDRINNIKRKTFELFRRSLKDIEVITFDELFERAKFIVNQKPKINDLSQIDEFEDVPF